MPLGSPGGNLAAAVALLSMRRSGPQIRLQALLYPVTDCDSTTASYRGFASDLNLDLAAMRWFRTVLIGDSNSELRSKGDANGRARAEEVA